MTEVLDPLPSAKGKTILIDNGTATNTTTTIRTVSTGKIYYLVGVALSYHATADDADVKMIIGGDDFLNLVSNITATYKTSDSDSGVFAPAVPIPIPAGTTIQVFSENANIDAVASIIGWEEDAP